MRLQAGDRAPDFEATDIYGTMHSLAGYAGRPLMISFYRYAACPLCNLRVSQLLRVYPQFEKNGLNMLAFFQSPESSIRRYAGRQSEPYPIVSDIDAAYYELFGLELATEAEMERFKSTVRPVFEQAKAAGFTGGPVEGDIRQLPADFLIAPDGTIEQLYYGKDISDHIPMGRVQMFMAKYANAA
ncbi:MAG: peroxiredoxin-like family protein [Chloroflexota bacterium]